MTTRNPRFSRSVRTALAVGAAASLVLVSACSTPGGGAQAEQTDSGGKITIWVDPPRVPAAEAFQEAYPDIETEIVQIDGTVGGKTVQQQFAQFDQAGKGWPDAIFFPSNDDIAWATSSSSNYAADLTETMADTIEGYDPAVLAMCEFDGQIRCLRNDAAPDVFWYNAKFFADNGYDVPTTWEDYGDLAVKIAAEHPGKISAMLGDAYAPDRYLWGAACPTNDRISETEVNMDFAAPECTRAQELLSQLVEGNAATPVGIFDEEAAQLGKDLVMTPGAPWYGDYLFNQTWQLEAKTMQAVTPLPWKGEDAPTTGNEGGGLWSMSSHITGKQLENTKTFMEFVASDPAWQVELSTGLPAFAGVQDAWMDKQMENDFYYDTEATFATFVPAISDVPSNRSYMLYNTGSVWTETVPADLLAGKSFDDAWKSFSEKLLSQAQAQGYTVTSK